ncbi:MAG: SDR family NAD(P)-dependent oxidoreductase [Planctomycetia bacterium]|nr:SDR family NAD(P)-dependent oxidoreductase [Planctomycetia bacterium]
MESYWQGKVALVTGGSSGLGREIVTELVRQGANVVVAALEKDAVEATVREEGNRVTGISVNVTLPEDVERLKREVEERFGRLDALFNVAGRTDRGKVETCTAEHLENVLRLNVVALVRVTQTFLPMLLESKGHVVNIGSLASKAASRWTGAYPASKFAVAAYSQQLRLELGERGLKTLLVCPGPIARETQRLYPLEGLEDLPPKAREPGAGVRVGKIPPRKLVQAILRAAARGDAELVMPWKAKILFAICQLWPRWGDWLILKNT